MLRTRILLLTAAVILVVIIFNLPKVVVDNDPDDITSPSANTSSPAVEAPQEHMPDLSEQDIARADQLKEKIRLAKNTEKSIIFADSLAALYLNANKYDSAAKFIEIIAEKSPTKENLLRTANVYYEAYGFAMDPEKQVMLGEKARQYYKQVLELDPEELEAKNKLAMTYLTTSNPMQGIMMLREILEEHPQNEDAMFNLGVLSMQSGQYDKAVERFSKLVSIYPANTQAQFFLGVSYMETGDKDKARQQFEKVKTMDSDPQVQATADSYLNEID